MNKLKISLSVLVSVLLSASIVWAANLLDINSDSTAHQFLLGSGNITVTTGSGTHTLGWTGHLPVSKGGTGNSSFTAGSIVFANGASLSQDNNNLFWDDANNKLGIGTNSPTESVDVGGTVKAFQVTTNTISATGANKSININPTGTGELVVGGDSIVVASKSSAPSSPRVGQIYFDTDLNKFRGYNGTSWTTLDNTGKRFQVDTEGTLTSNLVAYYQLEGASGLKGTDFWGNNSLADTNTVADVAGKVNRSASFVAANSTRLDSSDTSVLDVATGDFSVAFWLKTSTSTTGVDFLIKQGGVPGWGINFGIAGKITMFIHDGTNYNTRRYDTTVNDGTWHHFVFTRNSAGGANQLGLYLDGASVSLTDSGSSGTPGNLTNNGTFRMGANNTPSYIDVTLDEVGFWSKILSSTEASNLFNSTSGQTMVEN